MHPVNAVIDVLLKGKAIRKSHPTVLFSKVAKNLGGQQGAIKKVPDRGRWVPCEFLNSILDHFIDLIADF